MPNLPGHLDYPTLRDDPPKRETISKFFYVLDLWTAQAAQTTNTLLLARLLATNVAVATGAGNVVVTLAVAQPDTAYMVVVETSWNTSTWITTKTKTAFQINMGTIAPANQTLSWAILR